MYPYWTSFFRLQSITNNFRFPLLLLSINLLNHNITNFINYIVFFLIKVPHLYQIKKMSGTFVAHNFYESFGQSKERQLSSISFLVWKDCKWPYAYWFDTNPKTYFSRAVQCKILLFKMLNNVYTCKQKYDKFAPKFLKVYFAF